VILDQSLFCRNKKEDKRREIMETCTICGNEITDKNKSPLVPDIHKTCVQPSVIDDDFEDDGAYADDDVQVICGGCF
jgi:hypothetical protein